MAAAFSSYWVYQHLGNLSPEELRKDELLAAVAEVEDAAPLLREFALAEDRTTDARRWSFCRDLGRTRVVVIDCRAGRILHEGRRQMIDDAEWEWLRERTNGEFDHLLIGMSDPYLLAPAIHHAEAWNEAVCDGVWGSRFVPIAERIREAADLDHWASFRRAFERLTDLIGQVGAGERGAPPASIVALSGDVHNAYLADVAFPTGANVRSRVYQAVCSPIRNPLTARQRRAQSFGTTGVAEVIGRALAAAARVPPPEIRWRFLEGPLFENHLATLELDGRAAVLRLERATPGDEAGPTLTTVFERRLA